MNTFEKKNVSQILQIHYFTYLLLISFWPLFFVQGVDHALFERDLIFFFSFNDDNVLSQIGEIKLDRKS